jgi:hypothetical protein
MLYPLINTPIPKIPLLMIELSNKAKHSPTKEIVNEKINRMFCVDFKLL